MTDEKITLLEMPFTFGEAAGKEEKPISKGWKEHGIEVQGQ